MTLTEKTALAKTCSHFDPRLSSSGNCRMNGYAPFDCHCCNSYMEKPAASVTGSEAAQTAKNCKLCGCAMVWENPRIPGHFHASSCDIEDWPVCHDCMVEHCCQTNCLGCGYGQYPDCRFLELKQHYMSGD